MDISAHPRLDPKLKDTYDRIMGTSVGVKTTAPPHPVEKSPEKPWKSPEPCPNALNLTWLQSA